MTWQCQRNGCKATRAGLSEMIVPSEMIFDMKSRIAEAERLLRLAIPYEGCKLKDEIRAFLTPNSGGAEHG